MTDLDQEIKTILGNHFDVLFGVSGLDFSDFRTDYKCALIIAVPHSRRMSLQQYREEEFEALIHEARARSFAVVNDIAAALEQQGIRYTIPAPGQTSEEELVAQFSYKCAAVNAGLGWIGKNDVLITEKYGPQVTLHAILIDYDLPAGEPIKLSKCPPKCDLCRRACPHQALTGRQWHGDSERLELIDYQLCNRERSTYKATRGRKHSCGYCMVACPTGRYTLLPSR